MTRSYKIYFIIVFLMMVIFIWVSLLIGPIKSINIDNIINYIIYGNTRYEGIIRYRLLRTFSATVVGIGLAVSGLSMQYSLKNPLADPFLLGVSSGAALGVVLILASLNRPEPFLTYSAAMTLGLLAFFIVISLGITSGGSPASIIVAGVSVSYALSGVTIFIITRYLYKINVTFMWLFGTVAYTTSKLLYITTILVAFGTLILLLLSKEIYTLILGDDVSQSMGIDVKRVRYTTLIISALIASATVALAGPVGFIGLAAPWLSRLIVGSRFDYALIMSIFIGANLALFSDIAIRLLSPAREIPLTAFTALFGGPLLFYLTKRTGW